MNIFLFTLSLLNFVGLIYLAYLIYKRNLNHPKVKNELSTPNSTLDRYFKKINLHRFNPFEEIGGDQSFVLCLLDNTNSGVIITSLHHRDLTRVYAKPIKNGEGESVSLSSEEKAALNKTINN